MTGGRSIVLLFDETPETRRLLRNPDDENVLSQEPLDWLPLSLLIGRKRSVDASL
jgi:hypothetical protein